MTPDEAYPDDDAGTPRCTGCRRTIEEVAEYGHARGCLTLRRLERAMPRRRRRHAIVEWPGLEDALQDLTLGANVVAHLAGRVRAIRRRLARGTHPASRRPGEPVYRSEVDRILGHLRDAERGLVDLAAWEDRWDRA